MLIPISGNRNWNVVDCYNDQGVYGDYWSSSPYGVSPTNAITFDISLTETYPSSYFGKAYGLPVRCIMDN